MHVFLRVLSMYLEEAIISLITQIYNLRSEEYDLMKLGGHELV